MDMLQTKKKYYSPEDFYKIPKVDGHMHYYTSDLIFFELARSVNMRLVSICVDFKEPGWPSPAQQLMFVDRLSRHDNGFIGYVAGVPLCEKDGKLSFQDIGEKIETILSQGAVGVKLWKNIGMKLKDENGHMVMIDQPLFDPLLTYLDEYQIPLLGHFGEPRNCWLPIEEMTVLSDRRYFTRNPQYHMYLHPELPSYEVQIKARDRMLEKYPTLQFIGAHLMSCEWNVDEVALRLDRFPATGVDLAERVCHLQYQSILDYNKVRDFILKYQDRLIYATDIILLEELDVEEQMMELKYRWENHWNFFTQSDEQTSRLIEKPFRGLALPRRWWIRYIFIMC